MKRIVAALQMLIFGAVGLQIRPSRDWVWVIYYCDKYDDKVFLYYYLTPIVSYFISPENPPVLKERNRLTCGLMTEKRAKWEKDFPTEGNFLHRVRQYVEVQKNKI